IVFVNVNPQSTLLLGQARGAALTALVASELEVSEYTALQMKKSIVGHGKANKEQVQEMVMRLLALPGRPGPDAADALGLAICDNRSMYALFEEGGKFLAGRVMTEAESSAQIELESGKRVKVKAANVLLRFEQPAPAELIASAQSLAREIDLDLAWEFAPEA